ncbi:MAG: ribonuclease P protein component [Cyclobacteriaceae bacterium]|nr:MAG: ribonuclease P protein component [Cyclobacteriaceae bacterium]
MSKFPKSEILRNKSRIEALFSKGESFNVYPLRVVYLTEPPSADSQSTQVLVSIPTKKFKKAVDRNKLKRRVREAYRLNKHHLKRSEDRFYLLIGYIYIGKEIESYDLIARKLKQSLQRLTKLVGSKEN